MCGSHLHRIAHQAFGQEGQGKQDERAAQCGHADQGMEREADGEVERNPRQIEQRDGAGARQKRADRIEIADRLLAVASGLTRWRTTKS